VLPGTAVAAVWVLAFFDLLRQIMSRKGFVATGTSPKY